MARILVTGAAGFVGAFTARRLLDDGHTVVGIDNLNDYYDPQLKRDRLAHVVGEHPSFSFVKLDFADQAGMAHLFAEGGFDTVVHLGAQAGVRYSLENPHAYIQSNLVGFTNVLEGCRHNGVEHLVFASSSSVYGANATVPFAEGHTVDHPVSLYAATKKSNELLAHTYASLYGLPVTGLRFFTVYGPWGRPDMAYFSFTRDILAGRPIRVFNYGDMARDFTYIDDVVEGVVRLVGHKPAANPEWSAYEPDPATSYAPYRIYNIGNHSPVALGDFIAALEAELGVEADKDLQPMQPGDVQTTYADVDALQAAVGFSPDTPIREGLARFVAWYRDYYRNNTEGAAAATLNF